MPRPANQALVIQRFLSDVVDSFAPTTPMSISYNNKTVISGEDLRTPAVVNPPVVQIGGTSFRSFYTLVMVDPDAPTPTNPTMREYLHWMVTDIPETTTANFGNEIIPYESPRPTSGIHRMVFVLFQQQSRNMARSVTNQCRPNFNTRQFGEMYNLGSPTTVVYFNCQRERGSGGRRFT
ncbi:Protein HEADING DATE 3A [Zostera marina]|uniref:Protein HEADING DATE 3A n=1 Tax=Zostera marina TaxID=29655 RepID=A0A0K9P8V8_ZOSMR|nr:Protein HEADING DATE 3A [Zostera marina]